MKAKLEAAAAAGFTGIEVFYPCLEAFAQELPGNDDRSRLREAARQTAQMTGRLGLCIVVLQPILNYDGIINETEHNQRVEEVIFRMEICKLLGTDMMQIPSNFRLDDGISGDYDKVAEDLRELADIGLKHDPPIRFVYEAMCWSTHAYTWQDGWLLVQKVDRPNFGLVLDAFHIAGWEYGDPTINGGVRLNAEDRLSKSLEELVKTVPGDRVFYVQLVDAERVAPPIARDTGSPYYVEGQQPRMSWSRNCRLFPYETDKGGYLPIERVCQALLKTGFTGWISFELFNRFISHSDKDIPTMHARRGYKSWETLKANLEL